VNDKSVIESESGFLRCCFFTVSVVPVFIALSLYPVYVIKWSPFATDIRSNS